jgi:hypothetical protein
MTLLAIKTKIAFSPCFPWYISDLTNPGWTETTFMFLFYSSNFYCNPCVNTIFANLDVAYAFIPVPIYPLIAYSKLGTYLLNSCAPLAILMIRDFSLIQSNNKLVNKKWPKWLVANVNSCYN